MRFDSSYRLVFVCALLWFSAMALHAQDTPPAPAKEKPKLPTIADEPKTVDPAAFMPTPLAAAVTVDFTDSSLREVQAWLREKQKLIVLLENDALSEIGVLPGDPISDRLDKTPIYQFLNRLRSLDLAWYFEDDILHITSTEMVATRLTTIPYNIGDLVDAGYELETLDNVVQSTVAPDSWVDVGGNGAVSFLGDVMFISQTDNVQREVRGLLAALRKHGRRTFLLDPPQHSLPRQKLEENVTVAFRETPLQAAIEQLAKETQIDIRLDIPALRTMGVRQRQPITLSLTDRKLKTVLRAMLIDLELTWILRDGVLWITTNDEAEAFCKTAIYDVRDLCRDDSESDALMEAIMSQASANSWVDVGGVGSMDCPRPGTLIIHNTESVLDEVLNLLETYRTALRSSKPRQRPEDNPNRIVTVYYRMHAKMAEGLAPLLPKLMQPESWKSESQPEAHGEIFLLPSSPDISSVDVTTPTDSEAEKSAQTLVIARTVLIIRQTPAAHAEIEEVIRRVESGDPRIYGNTSVIPVMGMGMGGGMGGFGGGYFSIPSDNISEHRE